MGLFLKILSIAALLVFLVSAAMAGHLYWQFNFGDCKDGCAQGMVYIYFLPALIIAVISALIAVVAYRIGNRLSSNQ